MNKSRKTSPETNPSQAGLSMMNETVKQRERRELNRRLGMLRLTSLILACLPLPLTFLNWLVTPPSYPEGTWLIDPIIFIGIVLTIVFLGCFLLSRPGSSIRRTNYMCYTILTSCMAGLSLFQILL